MTKIGDDLFASYRKYKGMDVDSPQYKPLENDVVSKEELKKLKIKEYNEKNRDKNKIKRLEKIIAELREENKSLNNIIYPPQPSEVFYDNNQVVELLDKIKDLKRTIAEKDTAITELGSAIRIIMKYL